MGREEDDWNRILKETARRVETLSPTHVDPDDPESWLSDEEKAELNARWKAGRKGTTPSDPGDGPP